MDEQTVGGWLNKLQDRFDTLFETLAQQRVTIFQQQRDAFEALFGDENNEVVITIVGDQEHPDVKDKQENQDYPNIAMPGQVLEESILHTSDKVEAVPTSMVAIYEEHGCQESAHILESGQVSCDNFPSQLPDIQDSNTIYRTPHDHRS
ncbi:hypothetical protein Tco_1097051 [Tanacetum coccineum]